MAAVKKKKSVRICEDKEDRFSQLPDDLIHRILSFVEARQAVQTSALSKRWKHIWTTLPIVDFDWYGDNLPNSNFKFVRKFLSNRNHQSNISGLRLCIVRKNTPWRLLQKLVQYAINHNVEYIVLATHYKHKPFLLSTFSSNSLKKLELRMQLKVSEPEPDLWVLPALTTLRLSRPSYDDCKLSDSCLTCLPALKTLLIHNWDLSNSSFSFQLPHLTTLHLSTCRLPQIIWDFPELTSLNLYDVCLPDNMSTIFRTLVNLKNLTLYSSVRPIHRNYFISCPQLVNLNISTKFSEIFGFVVLAPKLSNFSSAGIFPITFGVCELKKVDIKLQDWLEEDREKYYPLFTSMLLGLGKARNLTFDLKSIEALSEISNLLAGLPSPFYNLMYVKLPRGYKESSIPRALRSYLLGGSPRASIVTELPQDKITPQIATVSVTAENVALEEPLAAQTKGLVDCENINKIVSVETVNTRIQNQHVVEDSLLDADRCKQIDSPVEGTRDNQMSSSTGKIDSKLWQGYEVNSEYVCLLDCILEKYPETFEHFTPKNKKLSTVRLNMLCTSLKDFTKISMAGVDSEIIVQYRDIFSYLQSMGFDLSWILSDMNNIQHLRLSNPLITELEDIDCRIDDAKSEAKDLQARVGNAVDYLQNLQTLGAEKMTEIEKKIGTTGNNPSVGFTGDDLLCGP